MRKTYKVSKDLIGFNYTTHTMKKLLLFALLICLAVGTTAQVTIQDDAKVGLIVTGTGNTINTTQIFGKSPEYAELKNTLATLEADIQKKAAVCEKMAKDNLPAEYRDDCRSELIVLNARRDSVQKIETRFREDVVRLAESFSKMELNSERLRLAKALFDEGKIREADHVLNASEMKLEGDALLAKKEREQKALYETDSLLRVKADEFALKARLKASDYGDSLRYDSAQSYFEQSRKYAETVENLRAFAILLGKHNQTPLAIRYCEAALTLARSESEEASLAMNLGVFYKNVQKMSEAEKMYLRSLEIFERLTKTNPAQFEPGLVNALRSLAWHYLFVNKYPEAQTAAERALAPAQNSVRTNLAHSHLLRNDWPQAKTVYEEYLKNETNPAEAKKTLTKDWNELEAAGITCPEMAMARAWLKE